MARAEAAAAPPPVVSAEGKRGRPQTLEPSGHGGHCSKQQDHSRRLGSLARHLVSSSPRQQGSGPRAAVSADLDARRPPSPTELTEMQQAAASAWAAHRARPASTLPLKSWVDGSSYGGGGGRRAAFDTDGFLHLKGWASASACGEMIESMGRLVEDWDPQGELVGFNTRAKEQATPPPSPPPCSPTPPPQRERAWPHGKAHHGRPARRE